MAVGDSSPAYVYEVTGEKIFEFCRAARYENLAYTNQPAAREMGLPGIVAPPSMLFAFAPLLVEGPALQQGFAVETQGEDQGNEGPLAWTGAATSIEFQGALVTPGDIITSVTSVKDKFQEQGNRFITLQVVAHNQRGDLVADYSSTIPWNAPSE
ncbi:MAG: MaoC family dehydratase N-terminal domain-containing protein [Chloroflexi bacterium]|nr:MaoC family dehydratase N-terminal domain-containing protein [Chloroflexota bacterium]